MSDPKVNSEVGKIISDELTLSSDATVGKTERTDSGVRISYEENGEAKTASFDYLLAATGRRSNLDSLDLQAAGITLGDRGQVDFSLATGQIEDSAIFIELEKVATRWIKRCIKEECEVQAEIKQLKDYLGERVNYDSNYFVCESKYKDDLMELFKLQAKYYDRFRKRKKDKDLGKYL